MSGVLGLFDQKRQTAWLEPRQLDVPRQMPAYDIDLRRVTTDQLAAQIYDHPHRPTRAHGPQLTDRTQRRHSCWDTKPSACQIA